MKKIIGLLTAALVIATVTSGCGGNKNQTTATGDAGASQATASTVNYVATIGDEKIPEDEFRYFLAQTKDSIEQMAGATDAATQKTFWAGKIGDQNAEDVAKDMALNNLVEYDIWLDKAKAANYTVDGQTTQSANTQLDSYIATLGTGEAGTKAYEKRYGITVDKTKVINANMSIIQKFYADQQTNTKMTDEELKKFYNDNLTKYQQVTVKQVLFLTIDQTTQQPLSQEKQDAAKKNAEDILKRVKAGEDIAALAKQYSEDPGSKDNGGEYTFPKGQMVKEFEDWSFSAKVGDVGLVKTQYGYHVIKLEKILGYDDVKDTVKTDAVANKVGAQIEEWKKDTKYTLKKNDSVYNTIKVSE